MAFTLWSRPFKLASNLLILPERVVMASRIVPLILGFPPCLLSPIVASATVLPSALSGRLSDLDL